MSSSPDSGLLSFCFLITENGRLQVYTGAQTGPAILQQHSLLDFGFLNFSWQCSKCLRLYVSKLLQTDSIQLWEDVHHECHNCHHWHFVSVSSIQLFKSENSLLFSVFQTIVFNSQFFPTSKMYPDMNSFHSFFQILVGSFFLTKLLYCSYC